MSDIFIPSVNHASILLLEVALVRMRMMLEDIEHAWPDREEASEMLGHLEVVEDDFRSLSAETPTDRSEDLKVLESRYILEGFGVGGNPKDLVSVFPSAEWPDIRDCDGMDPEAAYGRSQYTELMRKIVPAFGLLLQLVNCPTPSARSFRWHARNQGRLHGYSARRFLACIYLYEAEGLRPPPWIFEEEGWLFIEPLAFACEIPAVASVYRSALLQRPRVCGYWLHSDLSSRLQHYLVRPDSCFGIGMHRPAMALRAGPSIQRSFPL